MRRILPLLLLPLFPALDVRADNWSHWRGPEQTGVSRDVGLPDTWDPATGKNLIWKAPVGGRSTPPRRAETERLLARLSADEPFASTLCGARIEIRRGAAVFTREAGDAARNPRPDVDGVVDGRLTPTVDGPAYLALARFRAACFLIERETAPGPPAASGRLPPRRSLA